MQGRLCSSPAWEPSNIYFGFVFNSLWQACQRRLSLCGGLLRLPDRGAGCQLPAASSPGVAGQSSSSTQPSRPDAPHAGGHVEEAGFNLLDESEDADDVNDAARAKLAERYNSNAPIRYFPQEGDPRLEWGNTGVRSRVASGPWGDQ